jgi:threonyl-tRNA synthetase
MIEQHEENELHRLRHSAAHVMAQAVLDMFPEGKIAIGPAIEDGFYYDFDLPRPLTPEDLEAIEVRMREIIAGDYQFARRELSADEAREVFRDQPYKLELIEGLEKGLDEYGVAEMEKTVITTYRHDDFEDLCRGPHVKHTGQLNPNAVKLIKVAGAYWRGDERNPMLQRIYGTAWNTAQQLEDYLHRLAEAEKRDHRRLGRQLELFTSHELIGAGLPLWLPRGATVRRLLEEYILEEERKAGYMHVYTPHLGKRELYETSGHWEHYQEDMFPPIELDHEKMVLRPMNCPHHILVYASKLHSYRSLPIRIAELGTMYRYERSGVVSGLSRVRAMTLNDAHIFCRPDQIKVEFSNVMRLVERAYATLGIADYSYRLSLRGSADSEKYVPNDAMWDMAERVLREAMDALNLPHTEAPGEAAFYGPKLDIQIHDVLGHEEAISTIQVDFHLPDQFDLTYVGEDGQEHRPVIIHRGIISTLERMMAYLIELYAGAFPVWLAPIQVVLIPIADRHTDYGRQVVARLLDSGFRVDIDDSDKRMNAKIREAQLQKVPYMLVVGDQEVQGETVAVRLRSGENLGAMLVSEFETLLRRIVKQRSLSLVE